jgi:hypothetical protein
MKPFLALLALPLLGLHPGQAWPEDTLGRLFHTPGERAALDARKTGSVMPEGAPAGRTFTVNGLVTRDGRAQAIWINGIPYGRDKVPGVRAQGGTQPRVIVQPETQNPPITVKPGQTVDLDRKAAWDASLAPRPRQ